MKPVRFQHRFPRRSMRYLVLTLAGVLLLALAGIWPNHRKSAELAVQQAQLEMQLHEKQELLPLYSQLEALLKTNAQPSLPVPASAAWPRGDADRIATELRAQATRHGLHTLAAVPDMDTLTRDTGYLLLHLELRGAFLDLRPFLIHLHEQGWLAHLEHLEIQQEAHAVRFTLRLWIRTSRE